MGAPAARAAIEEQVRGLTRGQSSVDPKDIVEVVESVMASIQNGRASVNLKLYEDVAALAAFIHGAKAEIAAIKPDEINSKFLPAAGDELNEIVGATEAATNDIIEAVETIESLAAGMDAETSAKVTDAVTRVYEACGFQDITGQRVTKVVKALHQVEQKVQALLEAIGEAGATTMSQAVPDAEQAGPAEDELTSGPQPPGRAISQDDVDALFAGGG